MFNESTPVLVVGPSGIGKSWTFDAVRHRFPTCAFGDLDLVASKWAVRQGIIAQNDVQVLRRYIPDDQLFLAFGLQSIGAFVIENANKRAVIDVGAGFQVGRSAEHLHTLHPLISIEASLPAAYQRFVNNRGLRDQSDFFNSEFSNHRRKVYESAHQRIETTSLTAEETAERFTLALQIIIGES